MRAGPINSPLWKQRDGLRRQYGQTSHLQHQSCSLGMVTRPVTLCTQSAILRKSLAILDQLACSGGPPLTLRVSLRYLAGPCQWIRTSLKTVGTGMSDISTSGSSSCSSGRPVLSMKRTCAPRGEEKPTALARRIYTVSLSSVRWSARVRRDPGTPSHLMSAQLG